MVVFGIENVFLRFEHVSEGAGAPNATLAKTTPAQSRKSFLIAVLLTKLTWLRL
jgi:hypothetical protein